MSPQARRIVVPLIVALVAIGIVALMFFSKPAPGPAPADAQASGQAVDDAESTDETAADDDSSPDVLPEPEGGWPVVDLTDLVAVAPSGPTTAARSLGSLKPDEADALIEFEADGAGIARITFADIWETVTARRQAERVRSGASPDMPDDALRYVLQTTQLLFNENTPAPLAIPALAAVRIEIDGVGVSLLGGAAPAWSETAPGAFETRIENGAGDPIARVTRRFLPGNDYDITLEQRIENLTGRPLTITWAQAGPGSLRVDRSRYIDRRRYRFGFLLDPLKDPLRRHVMADDNDLLIERPAILKRWKKALEAQTANEFDRANELRSLWPTEHTQERDYELSWFGSSNRYFALAVHPVLDAQGSGSRALSEVVSDITFIVSAPDGLQTKDEFRIIIPYLWSPAHDVAPGATLALDLGAYAGPLDRNVLDDEQPFLALSMDKLILYQMSSFCAICTFQWLAHGLLAFLSMLHDLVLFDWGLAIIALVLVVRTLLHPITKKSQISMQRFGKVMGLIKPEMDKLQKKYPDDPKKLQGEQLRLMREHGVNPFQMLGCLPMFLQTPIWIALYAMLYFAFDIRQEPAFFGLFQKISGGHWAFLGDLSSADHCFWVFDEPFRFLLWNMTGINLLPILMGVIFFVQQKYMSPPPSPTMSEQQVQQQKMMKVMMVVMFPLFLYSAPSGLTLYILTSSCIGVLESRYVGAHISAMDLQPKPKPVKKTLGKLKDAQGRAYAAAMKRMEEKKKRKQTGPSKSFKKRK